MRRRLAPVMCLLTVASPALAADYTDPLPRYERSGNGFACHMSQADGAASDAARGQADRACMRIGPLRIGMPRAEVEKLLGSPADKVVQDGQENFAYTVNVGNSQFVATYAVVVYDGNSNATIIQLTGKNFPNPWLFSGLTLGDSEDALRARLGAPLQTKPSDEAGTVVWEYRPWTFSLEIHDHKISSIRIENS